MPRPSFVLLAAASLLAIATSACSSLTRPDAISIAAEPLPSMLKPAPVAAAPAAPAGGAQAAPPHTGG